MGWSKMERNEMIEILMGKANISRIEAEEALEKSDWDLLDAIFYLEKMGKFEDRNTTIIEVKEKDNERKENQKKEDKSGGVGEIVGRIFKFIGKMIKKGNENYFEIRKENEKPIKVSLTISALLLVLFFWAVAILLVVGYSVDIDTQCLVQIWIVTGVNDVLEKVSESADNIKKDFKEGYEK